ncbi:MAG: PaaI family thioesterase [Caulobacteraceae bacterium]
MAEHDSDVSLLERFRTPSPQVAALGVEVISLDPEVLLQVPYRADLVGEVETGVIAGGVITTLLDTTCAWAVAKALTEPTSIATLDLRIDYMRPAAPGKTVFATAHCYKLTRYIAFVRGLAYDEEPGDPVASAQAAFILDSDAGRGAGANLQPPRPQGEGK